MRRTINQDVRDTCDPLRNPPDGYWAIALATVKAGNYKKDDLARVVRGFFKRAPASSVVITDAMMLAGFIHYQRLHRTPHSAKRRGMALAMAAELAEQAVARNRANKDKVAKFDKLIEYLDHMQIGTKRLGDCTRADLEREAARLEGNVTEISDHIHFLRSMATLIGNKKTVRQADRARVLTLLSEIEGEDND